MPSWQTQRDTLNKVVVSGREENRKPVVLKGAAESELEHELKNEWEGKISSPVKQ